MPKKRFKGPAARALDAWYRKGGDVVGNLTEAQTRLTSGKSFTDIVKDLKSEGKGDAEFEYPADTSVLKGQAFEDLARQRYVHAIEIAFSHDPPVPITTTWETGAGNPNLQIDVANRANEVEVIISVPDVQIEAKDEKRLKLSDVRNQD